ncbi:MAG: beta-N-acetylhexosaminidase, partial [Myxococcales bacterium]|nr:beta-N-acetylhexosaminidase [Myxococcales bacterium]
MSDDLARDVGQILWVGFPGPEVDDGLRRRIAAGACGAAILFRRNLRHVPAAGAAGAPPVEVCDLDHLAALTAELHAAAPADAPLLVAIDQEGGVVQRVRAPATQWPPMLCHDGFAAPADAELAEQVGLALGRELAALGVDVDFAPVLDVNTNPDNPIIGDRAFGADPEDVARRALGFATGLARAGVLGCGKHFPGHGDTHLDSHLALPRVDHDRARLDAVELLPFRRAAAAGLPMLMTAHVVFAAVDPDVPATLSRKVVGGILRDELGYDGLVVSDDLDMKAIADHYGIGDAAVRAIDAGCDVLLLCRELGHQLEAHDALLRRGRDDAGFR